MKNGAAKLAKPPAAAAAAGEAPGGAPGAGLFMERSQSRLSLSASFEALAIYFPCMNSFDEEDAGTRGGGLRPGRWVSVAGGAGDAWRWGGGDRGCRCPLCVCLSVCVRVCVHPRVPWERVGGGGVGRSGWVCGVSGVGLGCQRTLPLPVQPSGVPGAAKGLCGEACACGD